MRALSSESVGARLARWPILESLSLLALGAMLFVQVLGSPAVGLADNGDYPRVSLAAGIHPLEGTFDERYWNWVRYDYALGKRIIVFNEVVTEVWVARAARAIQVAMGPRGVFELQTLGALNAALYLAAAALLLLAMRSRPLLARAGVCAALPLVLGDVGYVSFFNSFYGEPAAFVFLLATAALALLAFDAKRRPAWILVALAASSMLLIWAKAQYCTLGPVLVLLVLLAVRRSGIWASRSGKALAAALVLALLGVSAARYLGSSKAARKANVFNFVFLELTNHGGSPEATLAGLGLDPALARYSGVNYFDTHVAENEADLDARFFSRTSHPRLVLFCLRHPSRLLDLLGRVAPNAFNDRVALGQYAKEAGFPPGATSQRFSLWSRLKLAAMPSSLGGQVAFWIAFVALFGALRRWGRSIRGEAALICTGLAVLAIAAAQYVTAVLGEGEVDLIKHLILANAAFDLGMLLALCYALAKLAAAVELHPVTARSPSSPAID